MVRTLVIEDEADIADFIRRGLIYKGYTVDAASTGAVGLNIAHERQPDAVILDLMLPDMDGVEVCRRLREATDVPIIILSARDSLPDKIEGLDAGADDYLTKPFSFEELLARLRAVLRRREPAAQEVIRAGNLTIRPAGRQVFCGDHEIELTAREYDLLEYLARHPGQVLTKDQIFSNVWGYDVPVESEAIKVYVSYLRRKLQVCGAEDLIVAVRGIGYRLQS
jgi:two-component system response regulator MprA